MESVEVEGTVSLKKINMAESKSSVGSEIAGGEKIATLKDLGLRNIMFDCDHELVDILNDDELAENSAKSMDAFDVFHRQIGSAISFH